MVIWAGEHILEYQHIIHLWKAKILAVLFMLVSLPQSIFSKSYSCFCEKKWILQVKKRDFFDATFFKSKFNHKTKRK